MPKTRLEQERLMHLIARCDREGGVIVFKKLADDQLTSFLEEKRLPTEGGTYMGNPTWAASP